MRPDAEDVEKRLQKLEMRRPLAECQERIDRLSQAMFGDGEPEKSLLWRIGAVESRQRLHGILLWSTACMVGALFSKAVLAVVEGLVRAWQSRMGH